MNRSSLHRTAVSLLLLAMSVPTLAATGGIDGKIFGTTYSITVRADVVDIDDVDVAVKSRLAEIDKRMSNWRDDSDVSRFNSSDANVWVPVNAETASVVQLSKEISAQTNGTFDVTVGPLVRLWNFGAAVNADFKLPTDEQVATVLAHVGFGKLQVRLDPPSLLKSVQCVEVDLSAIAKGYAVDAVAELFVSMQIEHYMIEIGGEVRTLGTNEDGSRWRIGLEAPNRESRRVDSIVPLANASLATSGDYRNFFEHDGVTYSHTIDPKTGRPVTHSLAATTVMAETCARADALATAIVVMGPDAGLKWAEAHDVEAMLMTRSANEEFSRTKTSGFPSLDVVTVPPAKRASTEFFQLFLVTAVVFGIAILAMSVGSIVANRRLQGSCGGMAGMSDSQGKTICDMCTRPSAECSGDPDADQAAAATDA